MTKRMPPELSVVVTNKSRWGRPVLRLNRTVEYRIVYEFAVLQIMVPEGYETDLASIPCFLWPVLSPWGPWRRAAIVHDYLCEAEGWPRFLTDAIFRQIMYEDGVWLHCRMAIYVAVRSYWLLWGRWINGKMRSRGI